MTTGQLYAGLVIALAIVAWMMFLQNPSKKSFGTALGNTIPLL